MADYAIEFKRAESGHWVTIDGAHVLIKDSLAGGQGFTRAALQRKLIEHHDAHGGNESYVSGQHRDDAGHDLAGDSKFTFHGQLPSEVKSFIEGHPEARALFRVTKDAGASHGPDAMAAMGDDAYFRMAGDAATGKAGRVRDAVAFGHSSPDPEHQFLAAVHDNLPPAAERAAQGSIKADKLKAGQEFTIHGAHFRVVENESGYRVLAGPPGFPADVPVDALSQVPVDRGSLRRTSTKAKKGDAVPFSRTAYYLSNETRPFDPATPALTIGQGLPTHIPIKVGDTDRSIPVSYWNKDVIGLEHYVHPSTNRPIDVRPDFADALLKNFNAFKATGRRVPCPAGHSDHPDDNRGWVESMRVKDGRISMVLQAIGDDGAILASRNECSAKIDPDYVDEKGKRWGPCIVHVAFTPKPVVTGMGSFVPFAASRDGEGQTPVYYLSADAERIPEMEFTQLREALGVSAADVPDDKLLDRVKELRATATATLARAATAEARVTELSRTPAPPDPEALRDRADLTIGRIDLAVAAGDLPPTIAAELKESVVKAGVPNTFLLSRADAIDARPVDYVLGMFKGKNLGKLSSESGGPQSGIQNMAREVPGAVTAAADAPTQEAIDAELARTELGRRTLANRKAG